MAFTYKGLQAQYSRYVVTEDELNTYLEKFRQQTPRIVPVTDRPTQLGDEVVLDYAGFCDGVQFPGGTAENQTLVLGSGMFIPGFEGQLVDKVPGEAVTVKVTFPEAYHSQDLAGKEARFECTIKEIRVKTEYDADDTFAQEVAGCKDYEELRKMMGEQMQAYADERGEIDLQDRLLKQAAETMEITFSEEMIDQAVEEQMQNFVAQLSQQGLTLEMYCQFSKLTEEDIRKDIRPTAKNTLLARAAIDEIVELEGLTVDEDSMQKAKQAICQHNNVTMEQLEANFDAGLQQMIMNSVLTGKVMRLIRDNAVITEE